MNDEILRSEFEMSALFQTANETVGDITYKILVAILLTTPLTII